MVEGNKLTAVNAPTLADSTLTERRDKIVCGWPRTASVNGWKQDKASQNTGVLGRVDDVTVMIWVVSTLTVNLIKIVPGWLNMTSARTGGCMTAVVSNRIGVQRLVEVADYSAVAMLRYFWTKRRLSQLRT